MSKEKNKNEVFGKEDVLSVSGDYGIVNQIEFQGRSFAGASVAPYGIVDTGDIVYTKSPLKSNPYGIIKANKGKAGIVSTLYAVYKPLDNVCSDFVQIYFEQDARMNNYMHPLVNKGAKNDMKVSDVNALKGEVCFPSKDEQIKISEHFANLDRLITLHQRKCEQTKELKKFMLQKMFPKKGEKNPEIRFPGFTDDWEQRKAGEIFKSVSDKGYTDLPVLSASQELGMILRDEIGIDIKYDESSIKNYKRVKPGQFVIHLRSFQGGFAWSDIEGITSPAYTILDYQEPEEHCSKFWKIVLTSPMFITRLETVTYGIRDGRSISFTDFSTLNLNVPSIAEQQKIGEYFSNLDNLITLHQREVFYTLKQIFYRCCDTLLSGGL